MSNLAKYLANYAQLEVRALNDFPAKLSYSHVVVIPAYKETSTFIETFLSSQLARQNVLLIIVINQPDIDSDIRPQQQLATEILKRGQVTWQQDNLTHVVFSFGNSACLLVDRYTHPIDVKQGVGLARKIGVDIACQLISQRNITTDWLHSTDADATLPDNYFTELINQIEQLCASKSTEPVVAACYDFHHVSANIELHLANQVYEQALRYYVAGLEYAGSAYSFFTIGSILAFKASAYASVRGFPKKSAGEDFYLLNKLAKMGQVIRVEKSVIRLAARTSDRVPFGTGPAVQQILTEQQSAANYRYYHPKVFRQLKCLIASFELLFEQTEQLANWYLLLGDELTAALKAIHFEHFISKQGRNDRRQFNKQLIVWFDAFKTLKLIHYLRDHYYPNIPLTDAIAQADFQLVK
ncbi:hypothetical protein tinsulaeT_00970 [Thalassotalea insulae]|uniref:Glycosyl transferase family 2 n=1 Tax=Thalassotalea insulae TaxID=2056778 RepID=A0ABQ6GQD2_9GAMM|nr:hypothetical protein [Thalassotalea insulae]GLX76757.1 hypothetical protein tinsulaeT_00970 [Thalassotalea insulae]